MTVIVGVRCQDGIVVASDSQESDRYMKRLDVPKIYGSEAFEFTDAEMIVAGTGTSAYLKRLIQLIRENGYAPHFMKPRDIADVAEKSLRQLLTLYGGELDVALLLGVWCKNTPKDEDGDPHDPSPIDLYTVVAPGVAGVVDDYESLGSGGPFARYLLHRLHDEEHRTRDLTLNAAIREAIYVVEEVKKVQLHCGGETQVAYITNGGDFKHKAPDEIRQLVDALSVQDRDVKKQQREMLASTKTPVK